MARIAILIADMFEDREYIQPVSVFKENGHTILHIGLTPGKIIKGKRQQIAVTIDVGAARANPADYAALYVPGGYSPDKLRRDVYPVRFARKFMEEEKPVFVIGHGPQLLITACVLAGRKITGSKSIIQDIANAGAIFTSQDVVIDGNLVSSPDLCDLRVFSQACLEMLR